MTWKERQLRQRRFWTQLPLHASVLFFLSVFFLFGSIGAMGSDRDGRNVLVNVLFVGGTSVVYAILGTRARYGWIGVLAAAEFMAWPLMHRGGTAPHATPAPPAAGAVAAIIGIVVGYVLMLLFISTEGRRYYRLHTEVELAGEIHRALAPPVEVRCADWEFAGVSQASGMVGGDLLDVVAGEGGWLAYVADVAGHGVAAGVLMGVVKSAARTWLAVHGQERDGLLAGLNRTFTELMPPESYVTFAALAPAGPGGRELRFATAGHPPLLHFHASTGAVTRLGLENFPLGLFAGAAFASTTVTAAPGDVLALYTDGLSEAESRPGGEEFGLERLAAALATAAGLPLQAAVAQVLAAVRAFSLQSDDQTLLLARCLPQPSPSQA